MPQLDSSLIKKYVDCLLKDDTHRYGSWDLCYEAFSYSKDYELLALHLGFYLASWGMYRGSSGLLQKNYRVHSDVVKIITSKQYNCLRCSRLQEVDKGNIPLILELKQEIAQHYKKIRFTRAGNTKQVADTDTLLSKILLGTTGCMPAYDRYFIVGLQKESISNKKPNNIGLNELFDFIGENKYELSISQEMIKQETGKHYTIMKLIDMYFWQAGFDVVKKEYLNVMIT